MTRTFALLTLAAGLVLAPVMPAWAAPHAMTSGQEVTGDSVAPIPFAATEGLIWTSEALEVFPTKPRDDIDGTKTACAGLRKGEDRANLNGYHATFAALED